MKMIKDLPVGVRHAAIYASALVLSKISAVAMLPVFTHFLTPEEYGRLDILQTLANLLSIVIGFGLADTLFRYAGAAQNDDDKKQMAAQILGLAVSIGCVSLVISYFAAPWIADLLPGEPGLAPTRYILISLSLTGIILVPLGWLRMNGRPIGYFAGSAGRAMGQAILIALFLSLGWGVEGVLLAGMICAISLAVVMLALQWRETGIQFLPRAAINQGRFGGVLVLAGIATFILDSCDRWILAGVIGPAALADYALAGKIAIMAAFLTQPFEMWWLPKRFSVLAGTNGSANCARVTELGLCITMIAALGIAGAGGLAILWLTPLAYHGATAYVPVLAGLAALNSATTLVNTGVLSQTKGAKPIWIDGSAAVIAVAGYALLIPGLGIWGAIAATVIALGYRFVLTWHIAQRVHPMPIRLKSLLPLLVVCLGGLTACSFAESAQIALIYATIGAVGVSGLAVWHRLVIIAGRGRWRAA